MRKKILIALLLFIPMVFAQEMSSTDYRLIVMELNSGGSYMNGTTYQLFSSIGDAGMTRFENSFVCIGYFCFSLEQLSLRTTVTFLLGINTTEMISPAATNIGYYTPADIAKMFVCVEDAGISSKPSLGIVFSGREMKYMELRNTSAEYIMKMSQLQEGNEFLLPVNTGGCSAIDSRLPAFSILPTGFRTDIVDAVELLLSYPFTDIIGNFEGTGKMTLVIEKNDTDQIVVDVIR